jgi:Anaphase-promoting complex APC subunit CDC26
MLRRKPTRVELSQVDVDALDKIRAENLAKIDASAEAQIATTTRREAAVANLTERERLGLPRLREDEKGDATAEGSSRT